MDGSIVIITVREFKQRLNAELARGRPVCVPPMDYVANLKCENCGLPRRCQSMCDRWDCAELHLKADYLDALADLL